MSEAVFQKVVELVAARIHISTGDISPDSTFEELGIDSLAALSLIYDLEDEYNIEIPNEEAMNVTNIKQMVDSLERLGVE